MNLEELQELHKSIQAYALIAIWDGKSRGTAHMIQYMQRCKKPEFIFNVKM